MKSDKLLQVIVSASVRSEGYKLENEITLGVWSETEVSFAEL